MGLKLFEKLEFWKLFENLNFENYLRLKFWKLNLKKIGALKII